MLRRALPFLFLIAIATGCDRADPNHVQAYVEGEFVYVASGLPGQIRQMHVHRGDQVQANDLLVSLDDTPQAAARTEAQRRVEQAKANWEDATKGRRPAEITAIEAQIAQAHAELDFLEAEYERQRRLSETRSTSAEQFDLARSQMQQGTKRVAQLEAELAMAQLGARPDVIRAAEANLRAVEASLVRSEWELAQMNPSAPKAGLVVDTLYREGEWVAAGRPMVMLLPPENIKVRAFVSEKRLGSLKVGDPIRVRVDGVAEESPGRISYISPKAEYTPPVLYSQENRAKMVFMIEATLEPAIAAKLHPGQPVDVILEP